MPTFASGTSVQALDVREMAPNFSSLLEITRFSLFDHLQDSSLLSSLEKRSLISASVILIARLIPDSFFLPSSSATTINEFLASGSCETKNAPTPPDSKNLFFCPSRRFPILSGYAKANICALVMLLSLSGAANFS